MRTSAALLIAGLTALAAMPAQAASNAYVAGQRLAATCANCHGTNGTASGGGFLPLAGMNSNAIVANMKAFQAGTRPATIMHQIAKGYSDEQIQLMAAFFAAQKN